MPMIYPVQHFIRAVHDFDGNLLDTMRLHGELAADCMHKHFDMPKDEAVERYHATTEIPFPEQVKKIFPNAEDEQRAACTAEYVRRKFPEVYWLAKPFPDVDETISTLNRMNVLNSIATSTEEELTKEVLSNHGLLDLFELVWGCESGSKEDYLKTLMDADAIVFTGDSRSDMEAYKTDPKKVITVGRTGDPKSRLLTAEQLYIAGADYVLNDFRELIPLIAGLDIYRL